MKQLMKLCIIVAIFAQQYDAFTFECTYAMEDWVILDKVYGCTVKDLNVKWGDLALTGVSKVHLKGKTAKNVESINIENATCHAFPQAMEKSFPNLKGIRIAKAGLRSIGSDDLKPFPALRVLCLWSNELTNLDGNLLLNNPNLEFINFGSNSIKHVGPNFFAPLTKLVAAYFEENTCTNHTNKYDIESLKFEVAVKCPPSFDMVEITLMNGGKLATKNDEIDNKIKLLETRIAELEQQSKK